MIILGTNSIKDTGYDVANSLRFNSGSTDNLSRTFGTATSQKTFTWSFWYKKTKTATEMYFFENTGGAGTQGSIGFGNDDKIFLFDQTNGALVYSSLLLRDPSAWYHIVIRVDTTQSTATDRIRMYFSGVQNTLTGTQPSQNTDLPLVSSSGSEGTIGKYDNTNSNLDGYLAEVVFCDGQSLAPDQFGEFDEDSGIWKPIDVSGLTFGTNGFYLDFENSGALGNDANGSNNFTANNLTAVDQSIDTCTNNACTLNPLYRYTNNMTYSEGNLKIVGGGNSWQGANSTFYINKGKWFFEVKFASATDVGNFYIGWTTAGDYNISEPYNNGIHYYNSDGGEIYANGSALTTADYGTFANGDIMGMALDYDNSLLTVYKNGSALVTDYDFSSATTTAKGGNLVTPTVAHYGSGTLEWNFSSPSYAISSGNTDGNGYGNFEYAVPSGYYALNTKNLAEYG